MDPFDLTVEPSQFVSGRGIRATRAGRALGGLLKGALGLASRRSTSPPMRGSRWARNWGSAPVNVYNDFSGPGGYNYGYYGGPGPYYAPQFLNPYVSFGLSPWAFPYYYGPSLMPPMYDPMLGFTTMDPSLWNSSVAQLYALSPVPQVQYIQQSAASGVDNINLYMVTNSTSIPMKVRIKSTSMGPDMENVLDAQNNTLIVPVDKSSPFLVQVKPVDGGEWFTLQTAQGNVVGRTSTATKDPITRYDTSDPRFRLFTIGDFTLSIEPN